MEEMSFREYLALIEEKAWQGDIPYRGSFELTPLCNLNCKMCYVHLQDSSVKDKMLSGEQWISIIKGAIDKGMMEALLTGGEAMMHPAFWDIYMYLINHGILTQVKTNGLLLNGDTIKRFQEFPPYKLDISLYGCNSESYVSVTGVDAYAQVVSHIRQAIEAGLKVRLMITPSSYMSPWTKKVMELAKSFGVLVLVNGVLIEAHEDTGRKKEDYDLAFEESIRIRKWTRDLFLSQSSPDDHDYFMKRRTRPVLSDKGLYCGAGRAGFAVNWDGVLVPCLNFPRDVICADPIRSGFDGAWCVVNGGVKNYEVPRACHDCELNTKCNYCPMLHKKMASRHLCDTDFCNYIKSVYEAQKIDED